MDPTQAMEEMRTAMLRDRLNAPKDLTDPGRRSWSSWPVKLGLLLMVALPASRLQAQIQLNQTLTSNYLVENILLGPQVTVSNVTFLGNPGTTVPSAYGSGQIGKFVGSNTCLGLDQGVFLCTNVAQEHIPGPNDQLVQHGGFSGNYPTPDADLGQLSTFGVGDSVQPFTIYNKSVLEFDFVPNNDMIEFRYVFSSEEYERWACSQYNDAFGFFLSGPGISGPFTNNAMNIAFVPGSMEPVCINSINSGEELANANGFWANPDPWEYCRDNYPNWLDNVQYYRYNGGQWSYPSAQLGPQLEAPYNEDPYYIQHNGMTVVLTASAAVEVGETYHIKLAIGNARDAFYPSAVFLEQESFAAGNRFTLSVDENPNVVVTDTLIMLGQSNTDSVYLRFNRWGGFYLDEHVQITVEGDALAGEDYLPALPDSLHFNQLDSAVVFPILVPANAQVGAEFTVHIVTSHGNKVMSYRFVIVDRITLGLPVADKEGVGLVVFPNPANDVLEVVLPAEMGPRARLKLRDAAGRLVREQVAEGRGRCILHVDDLPGGMYSLEVEGSGQRAVAKVQLHH